MTAILRFLKYFIRIFFGYALAVPGILLVGIAIVLEISNLTNQKIFTLDVFLIAWLGSVMFATGKRVFTPSAQEILEKDNRPPVLYLRSFSEDSLTSKTMTYLGAIHGILTEEEKIVRVLTLLGPVIAVGRPGEMLPRLGAARLYVTSDMWKETVANLMKTAKLVVIRLGSSAGLQWEIDTALQLLPPERIVQLLPASCFNVKKGTASPSGLGGVGYYLPDGSLELVAFKKPLWWIGIGKKWETIFENALQRGCK